MSDLALTEKLLAGIQAQQAGDLRTAEAIYSEILVEFPDQADALHLLGTVAHAKGEGEWAAALIAEAIELNPRVALYHHNLGVVYESLGQLEKALSCYRQSLSLNPKAYLSAFQAGKILVNLGRHEEAISLLGSLLENPDPLAGIPLAEVHFYLGMAHREQGEHGPALAHLEKAVALDPNLVQARWLYHLYLPAIYQDEQKLHSFRSRFVEHLDRLIEETPLDTQEQRQLAFLGSSWGTPHHLQYQGYNDLELQKKYAQFVQRIVQSCYPNWQCLPRQPGDPLRVGFVSASMRACSYSRLSLGWVKYLKASAEWPFQVFAYHLDPRVDFMTEQYRQYADVFRHIPTGFEEAARQILQDQLDVLVYLEIGLSPLILQLASLRLAPVQCSTWAHPITSGLSTIDYFLSSDLMEPEDGQAHYSETLVRLPRLGTCFEKPVLPPQRRYRQDFGLHQDAVVYLTCQYLGKYLPQYDYLFPAIARQVPSAQFVFLALPNAAIGRQFWQRLSQAFSAWGLAIENHCRLLPQLDHQDYLDLNRCADVMLDSYGWSGGITTLEAVAAGLPVVTCPGRFLRGRHTYAILKRMGLDLLIAQDLQRYEELAVQLGRDPQFRQQISQQIQQRRDLLFEDRDCVAALAHFLRQAVWQKLACHTLPIEAS
ncbi:glycosyltransferase family 41 protein [Synechococcus sp. 65AY6Li]|uniref:O-linked N-acetylglucosamine transferase, SPINDLY family protein n=1 Tax=Synechococcus sp. 65AY6Li TaxID=1351840 RepID=UPI00143AFBAB|nr:glycosyltransferase family 41 protein [Synechococcus sp. 65AY6Li]